MRVFCIIRGASKWIPRIEIRGASGKSFIFVTSQMFGHVWDRGELGTEDSARLEDCLASRDTQHRPVVVLLSSNEPTEAPKKRGRPKKQSVK